MKKNEKLFNDVDELLKIQIRGLDDNTRLNKLVNLYRVYLNLCTLIDSTIEFKMGHFFYDLNLNTYQETESFLSPEIKWVYFAERSLKKFNDDLQKFLRSLCWIDYPDNSYYARYLEYNLIRYSGFIPYPENDNKIYLSPTGLEVTYDYHILESNDELFSAHGAYNYESVRLDISSVEAKNGMKEDVIQLQNRLINFKIFVEQYFVENGVPESLMTTNKFDNIVYLECL